ncbi:cell adhesion molecule CEACAM1-like [Macrotis lagotis]|uniref:cell adhesion molecule CEACAM1-like n=1 Tax=Macrotis lagotis TaxID=92651 RepID=UPI003D685391
MKNSSETLHTGGNLWKGLLITASILSCWIQSASTQSAPIRVVPNPPIGTVGKSIILNIQGFSRKFFSCTWYRKSLDKNNKVAFYRAHFRVHESHDIRKQVLANGSLVIHDLTLNDTDDYIVQFLNPIKFMKVTARGHLAVYEMSSHSGGTIVGGAIGGLAGVALIGALIYFLFFKIPGSTHHPCEKNLSAHKEGDRSNFSENLKGLKSSIQDLIISPATPGDPSQNPYQILDITRVDVYDKIIPWKKLQV